MRKQKKKRKQKKQIGQKEELQTVIAGSVDTRIPIGDIDVEVCVLDDETRVVVQRQFFAAIGISRTAALKSSGSENRIFKPQKWLKPFISSDLEAGLKIPRLFNSRTGIAHGYPVILLVDMWDAIIMADDAGSTHHSRHDHIVALARDMRRRFTKIGLVSLVDEITGYQENRPRDALLSLYLQDDFREWAKQFPMEFYQAIAKLKDWPIPKTMSEVKLAMAQITCDLIYDRIYTQLLPRLRIINPVAEDGRRLRKHHQHLTESVGILHLQRVIHQVTVLAGKHKVWGNFMVEVEELLPKTHQIEMFGGRGVWPEPVSAGRQPKPSPKPAPAEK